MTSFKKQFGKYGRHKWIEVTSATPLLLLADREALAKAPPFPTPTIRLSQRKLGLPDVVMQRKLYRCANCDWVRIDDVSPKGGPDFMYWKSGMGCTWSSYFVKGRPKCGEVKRQLRLLTNP